MEIFPGLRPSCPFKAHRTYQQSSGRWQVAWPAGTVQGVGCRQREEGQSFLGRRLAPGVVCSNQLLTSCAI